MGGEEWRMEDGGWRGAGAGWGNVEVGYNDPPPRCPCSTSQKVNEMLGSINTSSALAAFERMEEKGDYTWSPRL